MTSQATYVLQPPEPSDRSHDNYNAITEYFFGKTYENPLIFTKAEQPVRSSQITFYQSAEVDPGVYIVQANEDFVALTKSSLHVAYIETFTPAGDERTATQETATSMVALQWALLDLLGSDARFIINTENLLVPRSGDLTRELDRVRSDERLKEIIVLWSPLLLQESVTTRNFSGRDRLALAAVRFMDIVYSMRKRGLAPVRTYPHEKGLVEALEVLALDRE